MTVHLLLGNNDVSIVVSIDVYIDSIVDAEGRQAGRAWSEQLSAAAAHATRNTFMTASNGAP